MSLCKKHPRQFSELPYCPICKAENEIAELAEDIRLATKIKDNRPLTVASIHEIITDKNHLYAVLVRDNIDTYITFDKDSFHEAFKNKTLNDARKCS